MDHEDRQNLNNDFAILIANVDNLSESEKLHQLRKKAAYYYALMRYQRDYHEYYNGDNEVHPTDGGIHLGQPYYTTESYEKFVNNLFAYMMGDNQANIDYYTALSDDYYYEFVNNNKYIQDKGYNVSVYNAGWQEDDGQYFNKLINGGTVLNGHFRGKQLELEGYPTVLGDDGQTHYTLDENGRPWYNPNPSESSINRIVWQGYQDTDGQFFNVLADGRKVLTGEYKGNYNAKDGQAIVFDRETRTFSSGGFPVFPDGDPDLVKLTTMAELKESLDYASENGMLYAGGNSMGRGNIVNIRSIKQEIPRIYTQANIFNAELYRMRKNIETGIGRSNMATTEPRNLKKKLAMESVLKDPLSGAKQLRIPMTDKRWPGELGWVKMAKNVNGVEIHYVYNKNTQQFDDFKFK